MIMRRIRLIVPAVAAATWLAVGGAEAGAQSMTEAESMAEAPVAEVLAEEYSFEAPDELPSGWTTFRFNNEGEETHFVYLARLPEGKTIDDYELEVVTLFNEEWYALRDGEIDAEQMMERLGERLPEWFWAVEQWGGPGLIEAGGTTETTLKLEPGEYVVECYMKTEDGEFHGIEGMIRPLTVTAESSGAAEPSADVKLMLSNAGIETSGELTPGMHTVAVHFAEHPEQGFGHDVHLARLDEGADVERLVQWTNWLNVDGLRSPAPFTFLGGTNAMPVGYTAYVTVELEPGRYAWVAKENAAMGIVKEFTVSP